MLVFVQSIERAKELFHELIYDGMNVDVIHSERTKAQRDNVIKSFREGKVSNRAYALLKSIMIRIIIVTCAFFHWLLYIKIKIFQLIISRTIAWNEVSKYQKRGQYVPITIVAF